MATKQKFKDEALGPVQTPDTKPQVLDDQTLIDDVNKRTKNNDLQGFDKRLPAGNKREIRVDRSRLGGKNPIMVISSGDGRLVGVYDEIKIEGESQLVHEIKQVCGGTDTKGIVSVRTSASILIKKAKVR